MSDYKIRGEDEDIVVRGGLAGGGGRGPKLRLVVLGLVTALAYGALSTIWGPLGERTGEGTQRVSIFEPGLVSADHADLERDCLKCHTPMLGPTNAKCIECHAEAGARTMHEKAPDACYTCHAEHIGDEYIHSEMTDAECLACHRDIRTRTEPTKAETLRSPVSRKVFSHVSHEEYKCSKCHSVREPTVQTTKTENIFTMEACFACHKEDDCQSCHLYHEKQAGPKDKIKDVPE